MTGYLQVPHVSEDLTVNSESQQDLSAGKGIGLCYQEARIGASAMLQGVKSSWACRLTSVKGKQRESLCLEIVTFYS